MEAVALQKMTYREFREMVFDDDDRFHYELLDGAIIRKSSPSPRHQRLSRLLLREIDNHVTEKKLGEVFYAPIDVFLDEYNAPQPDLVFVSTANQHLVTNDGIMGPPDLVIEIIWPSSIRIDRYQKRDVYERFSIPEYWIADPQNQLIEVYALGEGGRYEPFSVASALDVDEGTAFPIHSKVLPDLQLDIRQLF
jgi:Uma2 family endonuclease